MRFCDMPYQRVDYGEIQERYQKLIHAASQASGGEDVREILNERRRITEDLTPKELCYVRHDMDVNDAFYAEEQAYYNQVGPELADLSNQLDRELLAPRLRPCLEKIVGSQAVAQMEASQEDSASGLVPLLQEENALIERYAQISSNLTVRWEGEEINYNQLRPFSDSADRETRKRAALAAAEAWEKPRAELEDLYDKLVDNRNRQAKLLGFSNYVEVSYRRMWRIGYGPEEVAKFRDRVKQDLVPIAREAEKSRGQRLGMEHLYSYDKGIYFTEGNPKPSGDAKECLEATRRMYRAMSPETAEFIDCLLDNGLYDVEIRPGKRDGGYMTSFEKYRVPFIFANFDGTTENAYIMCHEGGHAFQYYLKRNEEIRERCTLTSEAAETHAMAMEFFAWPYMELFFKDRAEDYRKMHLHDALQLILRECQQDEFQQAVYENPGMTKEARNRLWSRLEKDYFPDADHGENEYLAKGCGWQRIPHMFHWPFYAIDYALAQVCALEYCRWMKEDREEAWQSYLTFCRLTGEMSFPELVRAAGLSGPFAEKTMKELAGWLTDIV
ncbi:MAG: M3 family oligoendopeptidase [Eubacteriales bacterium]|nr:M3 family oligoendopeptidase [Eubacteriales bacterium]